MRLKYYLLVLICLAATTNIHSQDSITLSSKDNSFNRLTVCFGKFTEGEIAINGHLTDSLAFTNPKFNSMLRINSFHLTVKCKEQVIVSLENKSGNKLTDEMKAALKKGHPGCSIIFGSIKLISSKRDAHNNYNTMDYGSSLNLILK